MKTRTYLTITPDDKKDALRAAGRLPDGGYPLEYDRSQKLWFAGPDADLDKIKAWLPENTVTGQVKDVAYDLSPAEEFGQVLRDAGFVLPGGELPEMDGKRHRVATEGDSHGKKSGVYQGYMNGRPAGWYQDHRASEEKVKWTSSGKFQQDPAEMMKQRALSAQNRWDRDAQAQADYARMARTLAGQWQKMPVPSDVHPYLARKGVPAADGVKLDKYDNLVIPLRNADGDIRTLQYIKPDGTKTLKKGGEKTGNFFVVGGDLRPDRPVLYAEGYATAASLHLASGLPVVMTVDAGNMVTVSRNLKALYPDAAHVILGEDDFTKKDNKGVAKAREAAGAIGGMTLIPQFTDDERTQTIAGTAAFSDFNDIHQSRGLNAVRDQLAPVLDTLLPDWRQAFNQEHTMPDTHTGHDSHAERQDDHGDFADYAAYMEQQAFTPTEGSGTVTTPEQAPVPEPDGPQKQASESVPAEVAPQPVAERTDETPQSAEQKPLPQAEASSSAAPEFAAEQAAALQEVSQPTETTPQPESSEPAPVMESTMPAEPEPSAAARAATAVEETALPHAQPDVVPVTASARQEPASPAQEESHSPSAPLSAEENGFSFTFGRQAGDVSPQEAPVERINLDELLQGLSSRQEGHTWIYALDGQDAFRDYGDRIVMATPEASDNDRMILAALLSAKANQRGAVEITGSEAFILKTMTLIADHNIEVHLKNPQQRAQFDALLKTRAENAVPQNGLDISQAVADNASPAPAVSVPESSPPPVSAAPVSATPVSVSDPVAAPSHAPQMSVPERETLRTGLTGKLMEAGKAPYQFDKSNADSFYVELRTRDGNKTYWGVELEQALKDSGRQPGDMVKLQYLGKKAVTVNAPIKDADGVVTGFQAIDTHRNHWTIAPAADNRLLVADKNAVAPAELSAYDGNAFWALQQQLTRAARLTIATPDATGHGLMYTGPDGKGQPSPDSPPAGTPVPAQAKAAGSVVMHATGADGELLAHLVKGHGDYLQGVIRHEGELRHVLGRLCSAASGSTYLALNAVQENGALSLIGHGSAVNSVSNGAANFDTFAFQMKGKDAPKFAVPLVSPEKIPPALHSRLGFSQAYAPPKAESSAEAPRAQVKPASQPQPM